MGERIPKNSRESRETKGQNLEKNEAISNRHKSAFESAVHAFDKSLRRDRWRELHLKQLHLKQTLTRKERKELSYLDELFGEVDEREITRLLREEAFSRVLLKVRRLSLADMNVLEEQKMTQQLLEQELHEQREQTKDESQTTADEANRPP
jgi:hypothetical protein